jgi:hypothetical protein
VYLQYQNQTDGDGEHRIVEPDVTRSHCIEDAAQRCENLKHSGLGAWKTMHGMGEGCLR